jgi:hypothetical protein
MFGGFIPKLFLFQNVFTHNNYRNPTSKHSKKSQTMCVTLLISMMLGINYNAQQFVTYECSSLYVTIHSTFFCSGFHLINHKYEQMMAFFFHLKWWWNLAKWISRRKNTRLEQEREVKKREPTSKKETAPLGTNVQRGSEKNNLGFINCWICMKHISTRRWVRNLKKHWA